MKFQHGKWWNIKDFKNETSFKNTFAYYSIMIWKNFYSEGCKNPIISDKNSLY